MLELGIRGRKIHLLMIECVGYTLASIVQTGLCVTLFPVHFNINQNRFVYCITEFFLARVKYTIVVTRVSIVLHQLKKKEKKTNNDVFSSLNRVTISLN